MLPAMPRSDLLKAQPGPNKASSEKTIVQGGGLEQATVYQSLNYDTSDKFRIKNAPVSELPGSSPDAFTSGSVAGIACRRQFSTAQVPLCALVTQVSIFAPATGDITRIRSIFCQYSDRDFHKTSWETTKTHPLLGSLVTRPTLFLEQIAIQSIPPHVHVTCPSGGSAGIGPSQKRGLRDNEQQDNRKRHHQSRDWNKKPDGGEDGRDDGGGNNGGENDPPGPRNARPGDQDRESLQEFICPFFRLDPIKYQGCLRYKLSRYNDTTQHIERVHTYSKYQCPRCHWDAKEERPFNEHVQQETCAIGQGYRDRDPKDLTWGEFEANTIRGRDTGAARKLSPADKWYWTWDKLFPGIPRPQSPYHAGTLTECVQYFIGMLASDAHLRISADAKEHVVGRLRSYATPPPSRFAPDIPHSVTNTARAATASQGPNASAQSLVHIDPLPQPAPANASWGSVEPGHNVAVGNWSANPGVARGAMQGLMNMGAFGHQPNAFHQLSATNATAHHFPEPALHPQYGAARPGQQIPRHVTQVGQMLNSQAEFRDINPYDQAFGFQSNERVQRDVDIARGGVSRTRTTQPSSHQQPVFQLCPNDTGSTASQAWSVPPVQLQNQFAGMLAADVGTPLDDPGLAQGSFPNPYQATNSPRQEAFFRPPAHQPLGPVAVNFSEFPYGFSPLFPASADHYAPSSLPNSFLDTASVDASLDDGHYPNVSPATPLEDQAGDGLNGGIPDCINPSRLVRRRFPHGDGNGDM